MAERRWEKTRARWLIAGLVLAVVVVFFAWDLGRYLSLEYLRGQLEMFRDVYAVRPVAAIGAYVAIYVTVTGLSLPGAAVMTLIGGALFGLFWGSVIVSVASTLGATLAFVFARYILRDWVQRRFGSHLASINRGMERDGAFYLFALRLVPIFPFFVINLLMGLTPMKVLTFALVSQAGMLAATVVFVNAGTQLAKIESLQGIMSPGLIVSLCLLSVFPMFAKRFVAVLTRRKALRGFAKPSTFERDLVVIGAGSGGLVAALIGTTLKAKVTLIERHRMGGDCLNTGCVPSKAFIRSARFLAQVERSADVGVRTASADFDFNDIIGRVHSVIAAIQPYDSVERYESLGVECIAGDAAVTSPYEVSVNGRTLVTRNIVIAAGASPFVPPIPGIESVPYVTSDTVWAIEALPGRLVVLGGGPIGCELAQSFARFGVAVTLVEMLPRLLPNEDEDVAAHVRSAFELEGIHVLTGHQALEFSDEPALRCGPVDGGEDVRSGVGGRGSAG